ncbi:MotA/TolQ/ExbB proton channel family protein, partial [Pseudomonas sp. P7759]
MHATMEHMTIWGLISDASLLVKAVMVTLLLASLLSWYLIIQRASVLRRLERQLKGFVLRFRSAADLQPLYRETVQAGEGGIAPIFIAGVQEYQHLQGHDPAVLEGVERALQVAITEQEIELEKGLQFLATVGSVSPYIGLFGT